MKRFFFLAVLTSPAILAQALFVDDDGAQCPGALTTIQEAVAKARAGESILVCPGTYYKTVLLKGHEKDAIKLIGIKYRVGPAFGEDLDDAS